MLFEILIGFSLVFIYYRYSNYRRIKNSLIKWIPVVPGLPIVGNALDFQKPTDILNSLRSYRKLYGDLVLIRWFYQIVIMADHNLTEFILGNSKILKKPKNYNYFSKWLSTGILTSSGEKWKKRRQAINPSFHYQILEKFLEVFERNGNVLIKKLESNVGKESFDIENYFNLCALDNIAETAMGVSLNVQENSDSSYVASVKRLRQIGMQRNFSLMKSMRFTYPLTSDFWEERRLIKYVHYYTNSIIETRQKELKNSIKTDQTTDSDLGIKKRMAFLDTLFNIRIDGKPLSIEDIREEVDIFMFAGHDATTSALSFLAYCLSINPEVQEKAFYEQQSIFGLNDNRTIDWNDLQNMKYLEQVIKESFRMYPPVPLYGREIEEDLIYHGNLIPKGTSILLDANGPHQNSNFFSNPEKFDPNRFDDNENRIPAYAYIPFAAGPRNCIGQKFAMIEIKTVISKLLRRYKICEVKGFEPILRSDVSLGSDNGISVRLEKRTAD